MTMRQAVDLYTSFREERPKKLARLKVDIPKVVAQMGHVEAIDYRTTHKGKVTLYRHKFEKGSRPLLCVSGDGTQLMLLGGRYEWTDRGIQDADAAGNLIDNPKHGQNINPRLPKAARDLALRHKINFGRDAHGNYYISAGGKVIDTTASARPTAANALALVKRHIRHNPRTPKHICPICNREGGSHVPEALRKLGMPGEYAHPRCVEKSITIQKGYAPPGAVAVKRAFYFETHDDARRYAIDHGLPTNRIIPYSSGWAIQTGAKGRFTHKKRILHGNPAKSPARKLVQKQFSHYVSSFKPPKATVREAVRLFKNDPIGWSRAGMHRLFMAAGSQSAKRI